MKTTFSNRDICKQFHISICGADERSRISDLPESEVKVNLEKLVSEMEQEGPDVECSKEHILNCWYGVEQILHMSVEDAAPFVRRISVLAGL